MIKLIGSVIILGTALAFADVILPTEVSITGQGASDVFTKIVQVTGKQPEIVRGRLVVNADSQITCFKSEQNAEYVCSINVKK